MLRARPQRKRFRDTPLLPSAWHVRGGRLLLAALACSCWGVLTMGYNELLPESTHSITRICALFEASVPPRSLVASNPALSLSAAARFTPLSIRLRAGRVCQGQADRPANRAAARPPRPASGPRRPACRRASRCWPRCSRGSAASG